MAKFGGKWELQAGERVIGQEQAAYHEKRLIGTRPISGRLYVTDQRVAFVVGIAHSMEMNYPLQEVLSFAVKKGLGGPIAVETADGEQHKITGLFNKKLAGYLREAGVRESG